MGLIGHQLLLRRIVAWRDQVRIRNGEKGYNDIIANKDYTNLTEKVPASKINKGYLNHNNLPTRNIWHARVRVMNLVFYFSKHPWVWYEHIRA
jgi:hypothetical protein